MMQLMYSKGPAQLWVLSLCHVGVQLELTFCSLMDSIFLEKTIFVHSMAVVGTGVHATKGMFMSSFIKFGQRSCPITEF